MTATIIDGKEFAARVRAQVAAHVASLDPGLGQPGLAVVLVGADPASEVYVKSKGRMTLEVGMASFEHRLDAATSEADLLALVARLNADPAVHGILVQLPLPGHLDSDLVINSIDPAKDVDGFHVSNVGLLGTGQKSMVPCTPLGCLMMLRDHLGSLSGMEAVVGGGGPTSWASRWRSSSLATAAPSRSRTAARRTWRRCAGGRTSSSRRSGGRR